MNDAGPDDTLFTLIDAERRDAHETLRVECSPYTGGPWSPDHQHGGAVSALFAFAVDRMPSPSPMRLARMTLDMSRGVPLTPLRVETRPVRSGRRIQALDSTIFAGDVAVARASALRVRTDDGLAALDAPMPKDPEIGEPPEVVPPFEIRAGFGPLPGFVRAVDLLPGGAKRCGETATTWARLRCAVVGGEPTSAIVRLAALADFASGTGNAMDYTQFTSVNPDLSIHVVRAPRSDWIAIRGVTARAEDGIGQSAATVFDREGLVARVSATLLLDRR